jgi:hypothetical protein
MATPAIIPTHLRLLAERSRSPHRLYLLRLSPPPSDA